VACKEVVPSAQKVKKAQYWIFEAKKVCKSAFHELVEIARYYQIESFL